MNVEPTCLFCKIRLGLGQPMYDKQDWKVVSHTARCHRCKINQTFDPNGKPLSYCFEVLPYILVFSLEENTLTIRERANYSNVLMTCNYIPRDMTPENTTVEQIKTLILFS